MDIARWSIERPIYPWALALLCLIGGIWGSQTVGRLEDPNFPNQEVMIITPYPGASALEVEQEVTDVVEAAIQELPYVDHMHSKSVTGRSEIRIRLQDQFSGDELPQIFDELRRRVIEAEAFLPPGTGTPLVEDDFGDVFGLMYAVIAPGYDEREIRDISRTLVNAVKGVEGVAKVATAGEEAEALYVEIDHERLVRLGLPIDVVFQSISVENSVHQSGTVRLGPLRARIAPEMAFDSVQALEDMRIGVPGTTQLLRLADVATVTREAVETPVRRIRHNGERAFTFGVSIVDGMNVVSVGEAAEARVREVEASLPVGVRIEPIYQQHVVVQRAVRTFFTNLLLSVGTVVIALCLFMGWRAGVVVGGVLTLTLLGTLGLMAVFGIELQRISLGALMVAMGMLVDNGIVVAEGMVVGVRRGLSPTEAASRAVARTRYALLGATVIGVVAFAPISLSDDASGHYLITLFQVICISLLLSWVLAITLAPLFGSFLLRSVERVDEDAIYQGILFAPYQVMLGFGLRRPWVTSALLILITLSCVWGFQNLRPGFFPMNSTPLFYVNFWLPEGSDIDATSAAATEVEALLAEQPEVTAVSTFVGQGPTRFTTIMNPEQPNPAYAQFVARVADVATMDEVMVRMGDLIRDTQVDADTRISRAEFTPSGSWKFEARVSGEDHAVLRQIASEVMGVYEAFDLVDLATDWRQQVGTVVPQFNDVRARAAGVTRRDLAQSLAFASDGVTVGLYRERDHLLPIIARAPEDERHRVDGMLDRLLWSPSEQRYIPLRQVVDGFALQYENATIYRRDRIPTVGVLANAPPGQNPTRTLERVMPVVNEMALPAGYQLEWGGEFEANERAVSSLAPSIAMALVVMFVLTVLMFGAMTQAVVIWLTVPMIVCGVVLGMLATDSAFTFLAFLGFLSLVGMLIKNCIVLVDEIDQRLGEERVTLRTIHRASVSRLRPVTLAAGTTIAGMAPLLTDAFFGEMAVCIMSGLAFATVLTLIAVPVFYRIALRSRLAEAAT